MQLVIRSELNVEKTIVYAETHVKNTHEGKTIAYELANG
jgi:hypothetical protein